MTEAGPVSNSLLSLKYRPMVKSKTAIIGNERNAYKIRTISLTRIVMTKVKKLTFTNLGTNSFRGYLRRALGRNFPVYNLLLGCSNKEGVMGWACRHMEDITNL
jgi:hypothetical protein